MAEVLTEGLGRSWWAPGVQGWVPLAPGLHEPPVCTRSSPLWLERGGVVKAPQSFAYFKGLSLDSLGSSTESQNF